MKKLKKEAQKIQEPAKAPEVVKEIIQLTEKVSETSRDSLDEFLGWEECEESTSAPKLILSRTSQLILDYRQFLAARKIQTALRRWYWRLIFLRKRRAAIIIQKAWRGFYARMYYFRKLEQMLQDRIIAHYHRCATLIQSLWRGWWVRVHVHDHFRLRGLQVATADELLQCVAFKLHHLLRTNQIPGVYSLRNSNCLSKVEKLMAAMSFKQHNENVRRARERRVNEEYHAKMHFEDTRYGTEVPYSGPNFKGLCDPKCCQLYDQADADRRMYRILDLYQKAQQRQRRRRKKHVDKKAEALQRLYHSSKPTDFCTDVVKSMTRWSILAENKVSIDEDIFKRPHKLERFLSEIESIYSMLREKCHCNIRPDNPTRCKT